MIYLFSGTPGSGKSLDMARNILQDLRTNKPVICNFPITVPKNLKKKEKNFYFWDNDTLTPAKLVLFADTYFKIHKFKEGSIVLYIDECQLLFNCRTWNIKGRSDWTAFFTNHRHFGYDVILVAQFDKMIDKQILALVEYEYIHRKLNNLGLMGLFFRLVFLSPTLFVRLKMYYPLSQKLGTEFFRYSSKYSKIYDSYSSVFIKDTYGDILKINDTDCPGAIVNEVPGQSVPINNKIASYNFINKVAILLIFFLARFF